MRSHRCATNHSNRHHGRYVLQPHHDSAPIPSPIAPAPKYAPNNQATMAITPHSMTNYAAWHSEAYQPPRESIDTSHQLAF
jgi:hypothetical protein